MAAVICDLLRAMGGERPNKRQLQVLTYAPSDKTFKRRNRLRVSLILGWLAFHPDLCRKEFAPSFLTLLSKEVEKLSKLVPAEQFVTDAERREELARFLLRGYGVLPSGESLEEAENRFAALSSVKRDEVVRAAKAAEKRARKIREEMAARERAQRAASVYSYE